MATYEEIHGKRVETFSSDPTLDSSYEGQVWFNSTSGTLKAVVASAAWRSGTPFVTSGYGAAGSGSLTAGLIMGRNTLASGDTPSNATEEWNGSGWATGGNLSTGRYYGGALGTQTATVFVGGDSRPPGSGSQTTSENYNGTSWTSGTAYPVAVTLSSGFGTTSAGVMCNGSDTTYSSTTKEYDGSWTAGGSLSTARRWIGTAGTQTAGLAFGGQVPPSGHSTNVTEEYGGTSWTSGGSLNVTRAVNAVGGGINQDASQTNALASGGYQSSGSPKSYFNETEAYDGTSWSAQPTMATARGYGTGGGTGSAGIVVGAYTGSVTTAVEEFDNTVNTFTAGAWASGSNYPTGTNQLGGSGTQTAGLGFGGNTSGGNPNGSNVTAEYDGSSWTAGGNLTQNKNTGSRSGVGIQTATMAINFRNDGSPSVSPVNYIAMANVEEYNGSSWSNGTNTPDGEVEAGTCGTISAALRFGGNPGNPPAGPATNSTIYWNDSSWTSLNNMSTARYALAPAFQGTYNAALGFGGQTPAPANVATTEEFDGTNWTAGGSLNTAVIRNSGSGTQTAALSFGGSPNVAGTEAYDGTAWSTRPSLANGRGFGGGAGSGTVALYIAGDEGVHVEEFTGETSTINAKTLTTS